MEQERQLNEQVKAFLGDDDETEISKWIIKRVDRKGYEVQPCSYILVKVNNPKLVAKRTAA